MKFCCYLLLIFLTSTLQAAEKPVVTPDREHPELLYISLPNGFNYTYNTKEMRIKHAWFKKGNTEQRDMGAFARPWGNGRLKKLTHSWVKFEIKNDQVLHHYVIEEKDKIHAEVTETITSPEKERVRFSFELKYINNLNANLAYRLYQKYHNQVSTNGLRNGRAQVLWLLPKQKSFQVDIKLKNNNPVIPVGYSVRSVKLPAALDKSKGDFEPSGMDFDKNGNLYVSTRTQGVWRYKDSKWNLFASGLYDTLGVHCRDEGVYIVQKPELTLLQDKDNDGVADYYQNVSNKWRFTGEFHEFAYGPVFDSKGNLFISTNLSDNRYFQAHSAQMQMCTPLGFRGCVLRKTPDGKLLPFAYGFRSPAGIAVNQQDDIFITDNQGDWVPSSYLIHVNKDKFHGHPASLWDTKEYGGGTPLTYKNLEKIPGKVPKLNYEKFTKERIVPTVWLPHEEFANSPGNPEVVKNEKFGPFKDQMFIGDFTTRKILRVCLEKVSGVYQGAVMNFISPMQCGAFRLRFDAKGRLWVGELSRGWARGAPGIEVISWDGKTIPFEILKITLTAKGFDVHFTEPLSSLQLPTQKVQVEEFNYDYTHLYGSQRMNEKKVPAKTTVSADRRVLHISLPTKERKVYRIQIMDLTSVSEKVLINNVGFYTLNKKLKQEQK